MFWIFIGILLAILGSAAYASCVGAPWVPAWRADWPRIARLVAPQAKELANGRNEQLLVPAAGETIWELGSGDGRLLLWLAQEFPGTQFVGVEMSVLPYLIALARKAVARRANVRFVFGNLFNQNLRSANAVYFFLMEKTNKKLAGKLAGELPQGARVVSYVWPVPGLEEAGWRTGVDEEKGRPKVYAYRR